jgi:hypothetical protein
VASSGCGFVFGYLMTRLYLQGAISRADEGIAGKNDLKERLEASRNLPPQDQNIPTDVYSTDEEYWNADPNKGKFGGKSEANGWKLSASIRPKLGPDVPVCDVRLTVGSDPPTNADVTFYLHPSFNVRERTVHTVNGVAELKIVAWGAFTVGVKVQEPDKEPTFLELDLAEVPGAPPAFREV